MKTPIANFLSRLGANLLGATLCLSALVFVPSAAWAADETSAPSGSEAPREESESADPQTRDEPDDFAMNNPGSILEQFRRDRETKDFLFQIPGVRLVTGPWSDLRKRLDERYGFRPAFSFTHLYQWADDTAGGEDDGSGFEVNVDATWTFFGRETSSPSMAGFEFLYRDKAGTNIPPVALFTQTGALYPSTVAFGDVDPTIGQLWLQQVIKNRVGFRIGKYFPISAYDFFPLKNFRTDFLDGIHAANLVIPLPDRGLGGYVMYRPHPRVYVRTGLHDANADAEKAGFNSLFDEGELFKIVEVGFDPGFVERAPGRPPAGDIHVSFWHQDEREDDNVDDGWGFVLAASQRFGRFLPFLRYGYADGDRTGPTPIEQMVNGGLAIDNIFGQSNDRIGIGLTWSRPTNGALDDQGAIDAFYRIQVTPEIALSPTVQLVIDPVRHPHEDTVWVLGIRSRFAF
jgi:porin